MLQLSEKPSPRRSPKAREAASQDRTPEVGKGTMGARDMNREEMKEYIKVRCSDFLNFEGGEVIGADPDLQPLGTLVQGFYIEIEDVIDIIQTLGVKVDANHKGRV